MLDKFYKFFAHLNSMLKKRMGSKGFTIIELLVVIAIVGLVVTIVVVTLSEAQAKARDGTRKAEVDSIRKALALYYSEHGKYPKKTEWASLENDPTLDTGEKFSEDVKEWLPTIPEDPLYGQTKETGEEYSYKYKTDTEATEYKIHVEMETEAHGTYETYSSGGGEIAYERTIYDCSTLDQTGVTYRLTTDILNSDASFCINIVADDITLDCQGHTIDGINNGGSYGVYNNGFDNTIIKNCTVTNFAVSIYSGGLNSTIESCDVGSASGNKYLVGIYVLDNSTIENNNIQSLTGTSNSLHYGMRIGNNNIVKNNTIHNINGGNGGNGAYGIDVSTGGNNNEILNNTIHSITGTGNGYGAHVHGIVLKDGNSITNNMIYDVIGGSGNTRPGSAYGIQINNNNTLSNNKIYNVKKGAKGSGGVGYGIYLSSSSDNLIYNNLFNNPDNFHFGGTIYTNQWNTTTQTGVRIYSPGNKIAGNYWTNASNSGYSDTCTDSDTDGFCDNPYTLETDNIDNLPLSDEYTP